MDAVILAASIQMSSFRAIALVVAVIAIIATSVLAAPRLSFRISFIARSPIAIVRVSSARSATATATVSGSVSSAFLPVLAATLVADLETVLEFFLAYSDEGARVLKKELFQNCRYTLFRLGDIS